MGLCSNIMIYGNGEEERGDDKDLLFSFSFFIGEWGLDSFIY